MSGKKRYYELQELNSLIHSRDSGCLDQPEPIAEVVSIVTVAKAVAGIGMRVTAVNDVARSTKPCPIMVPEVPIERTMPVYSKRKGMLVAVEVVVVAPVAARAVPATPP